jgi:hypothetical protein
MNAAASPLWRAAETIALTLVGIAFFFAIIGVFGLPAAIGALVLFIALAICIFRRRPREEFKT